MAETHILIKSLTIQSRVNQIMKGLIESNKTTQSWSIFRVPHNVRRVRFDAFVPENFVIGVIDQSLECYDKEYDLKMQFLAGPFKSEIDEDDESQSYNVVRMEEVLKAMMDLELKMRECYSQAISIETDELVDLMAINGCFVVELLRSYSHFMTDQEEQLDAYGGSSDSPIFAVLWVLPSLLRDLIKIENQLPFFVLEKLFLLISSENDEPSLQHIFATFFTSILSLDESIYRLDPSPTRKYAHPLDLCRSLFIFPIQQLHHVKTHHIKNPKLMYSVQELLETGVVFVKKEGSPLLDISFIKGVLMIPPLSIDENITTCLMNFAIYEQCDQLQGPYFTNYILFLDCLVKTIKDIEILRKNGIIRYPTGTEKELVDLLHNFCREMSYSFDQNYFLLDINVVNNHCKSYYDSNWRIWWSDMRKERFSSPWTFLSLVAAIVLLVLTMLQALYTIIPYYHPIKG